MTADEETQLVLFVTLVNEMLAREEVHAGELRFRMEIRFASANGDIQVFGPDPDQFLCLAVSFRRLVLLKKEPTHIDKVISLLGRVTDSEQMRMWLGQVRSERRRAETTGSIALKLAGRPLAPRQVADWWFNGKTFHGDPGKRASYDSIPPALASGILCEYVIAMIRVTCRVAELAELEIAASRGGCP